MARRRQRDRERYATDAEHREKCVTRERDRRANHGTTINARSRQRYADDPEYREKKLARANTEERRASRRNENMSAEAIDKRNQNAREFRAKNGDDKNRDLYLRRQYGITLQQQNSMASFQNGLCAICEEPLMGDLNIDHDHSVKDEVFVRAILCRGCNSLLGLADDSPKIFQNAIRYLRIHKLRKQLNTPEYHAALMKVGKRNSAETNSLKNGQEEHNVVCV